MSHQSETLLDSPPSALLFHAPSEDPGNVAPRADNELISSMIPPSCEVVISEGIITHECEPSCESSHEGEGEIPHLSRRERRTLRRKLRREGVLTCGDDEKVSVETLIQLREKSLAPLPLPKVDSLASESSHDNSSSRSVVSVYEDGSLRRSRLFDTVKLAGLLHGERIDRSRSQHDYIFVDEYTPTDIDNMKMNVDARRSLTTANAGGKSVLSEMLSMQYFSQVLRAEAILLENEVEYWIDYKMVDYVCTVNGVRVGVSVTRAMSYPNPDRFTYACARDLLNKKLYGLIVSRNSVAAQHTFFKSVLHVWCQTPRIAALVKRAYEEIDVSSYGLDIRGVVILLLTVCPQNYIYTDRLPEEERRYLESKRRGEIQRSSS